MATKLSYMSTMYPLVVKDAASPQLKKRLLVMEKDLLKFVLDFYQNYIELLLLLLKDIDSERAEPSCFKSHY